MDTSNPTDLIEIAVLEEVPLRALEEDEAAQHLLPDAGGEVEFRPEAVEFAVLQFAQYGLAERLVVAETSTRGGLDRDLR